MFAQFPKQTLFTRIVSGVVAVSFILTSVPIRSYAAQGAADKLRPQQGKRQKTLGEIARDFDRVEGRSPETDAYYINLAAENVIIGGENAKTIGQHTGIVLTLNRLKELKLLTAILGHSATRNDSIGRSFEGTEVFLKELARPKVDLFIFGPERKGTQGKNAIISAFNQVCERYSYELKLKKKLVMDVKVEPYVIAAVEGEINKAKQGGKALDFAEAFFEYLGHFQAREIEAKIFDKILNDRILGQLKDKEVQIITLCVGSENKGLPVEAEILAVKKQLDIDLNGVSAEDLVNKEFLLAFEPTSKIGTGTAADPDYIRQVHQAIFDWLEAKYGKEITKNVWGKSFFCLYGGSANDKSITGIMAVKSTRPDMQNIQLVHGVLFATYGQQVLGFVNISKAVNEAAVRDNAHYVCFVNLKAFKEAEKTPRKEYLNEIYAAIKREEIDPVKTKLIIADQDTYLEGWKELLNTEHSEFVGAASEKATASKVEVKLTLLNKFSAYLSVVSGTEEVGPGYSKGIIASSEKIEQLEKLFGEKTKKGDTYFLIGKNNAYFALAKENSIDQTLTVLPTVDLSNPAGLEAYYSSLLEYASLVTTKSQKGLELINIAGDELKLKSFLTNEGAEAKVRPNSPNIVEENFASGNLVGKKRWMDTGLLRDKFFQFEYNVGSPQKGVRPTLLTFKKSKNKLTRGWSVIVQPKYTHLIFGFGTIGSEVAKKSREMGFNVVAVNRSANEKAGLAQGLGIPLYLLNPDDKKAFEKAKVGTEGILEDLLKSGEVDLITDATDGETEDPETKEEITVAAYNKKYIYSKYPNIKVMYEGAEDPQIADRFFDSGTLNVLKIPYSEIMKGVHSLFFPSCNTTGQGFILDRIASISKELDISISTHRRANDPGQKGKSSPDGTSFETGYHHADDYLAGRREFKQIMEAFKIGPKSEPKLTTDASTTHLTKFHIVEMFIKSGWEKESGKRLTAESVKKVLSAEPRIALVDFKKDKFDTTLLIDILQNKISVIHPFTPVVQVLDLPSGDVKIMAAVPQESIVIPNNMNGIHALTGLYEREASTRMVNDVMQLAEISQAIESTLPLKSARIKSKEPPKEVKTVIPGVVTYSNKELEDFKSPDGKLVYVTLNGDIGDIEGNKVVDKQAKKLEEGFDNLELLSSKFDPDEDEVILKNALYLLIHNGRPGGKYVKRLSVYRIVEWYANRRAKDYGQGIEGPRNSKGSKKIKEDSEGRVLEPVYWTVKNYRGRGDVKVWFLPDVDEQSIREGGEILKKLNPGDWAIAEDRRMDPREQAGEPSDTPGADPRESENVKLRDEAMKDMLYRGGKELLVGPIGFNFGRADLHRWDARITSAGKFLLMVLGQNIAEFSEMIKGTRTLIDNAHKRGSVALIVSGVKKDKIDLAVDEIKNKVLIKGDQLKILGATAIYPLIADGLVDKETVQLLIDKGIIEQEALNSYYELKKVAAEEGIKIWYPKNLKLVKLIDEKELKEGEDLLPASIQKAKEEDILVVNDGRIPKGCVIADVDNQALNEIFNDLEDENVRLIFQSGPIGPFDLNVLFAKGSDRFQQRLKELSAKKMVICFGSDTVKANKNAKVEGAPEIDEKTGTGMNSYTEGGAGLAALALREGEDLPAIEAAKESAKIHKVAEVDADSIVIAEKLNALNKKVTAQQVQRYNAAEETTFAATGREALNNYTRNMETKLETMGYPLEYRNLRGVIITPDSFKIVGAKNMLSALINSFPDVKVGIGGEDAETFKILLGKEDAITGKTLEEVWGKMVKDRGIMPEHIIILRHPDDIIDKIIPIRQIVVPENIPATLAGVKILNELYRNTTGDYIKGDFMKPLLQEFLNELTDAAIIEVPSETKEKLFVELEQEVKEGIPFEFSKAFALTKEKAQKIEHELTIIKDFLGV